MKMMVENQLAKVGLKDGYDLLHRGVIALAEVERNGMRVDVPYIHSAIKRLERKIKHYEQAAYATEECKEWKRKYGPNMNLNSGDQLADILYNEFKYKPKLYTDTGKPATSEEALEILDGDFVENFFQMKKYQKAKGTYLEGTLNEVVDGFIHPSFTLHNVRSMRTGCNSPNVQNVTNRNKKIKNIVRKMYIPREVDRHIVEIDYSTMEVRVGCFYHKDPTMLKYMSDPTTDMHRDSAADAFMLEPDNVSDGLRQIAKQANFSFFYGSWYPDAARTMWENCKREAQKTAEGVCIFEHLKRKGITELGECNKKDKPPVGTFEHHMMKFENKLWNERFPVYTKWKNDTYNKYKETGYFDSILGFRYSGFFKRNDVTNWQVQGEAAQHLIWALGKLQEYLLKTKMRSCIIAQVHDSIIADVANDELRHYIEVATDIMTTQLCGQYAHINVPIITEAEVSPMGMSWADKVKWGG